MRRLTFLLILPLIAYACGGPEKYEISGNIKNMNKVPVALQQTQNGEWTTLDSAQVEFGEFSFTGKLEHPRMMRLSFGNQHGDVKFFAENADIQVKSQKDSLPDVKITGSETHDQYEKFQKELNSYNKKMQKAADDYRKARQSNDSVAMEKAGSRYQSVSGNRRDYIRKYAENHPQSVLAPYLTRKHLLPYMEYPELDSIYKTFAKKVKQTSYGKALNERRNTLQRTQVGKKFIDFTLPDTSGTPVSFSDHVGDGYVLLDFWAAWCGPCRRENPNLVDAYQKYHDQGFEIFGVSFDKSKKAWIKAIHKDNITWPQVSDLEYWDNKAGEKYGIRSIPSNFLIDEEGKIVEKNLRGEELDKKLQEIYGEES